MKSLHRSRQEVSRMRAAGASFAGVALMASALAVAQELPKGVPAQDGGTDQAGLTAGQEVTHGKSAATRTAQPTAGLDVEFVDKAQKAGKSEVQASQVAVRRSANPAVKRFAQQMVSDHSKTNEALRRLGAKKGVSVPNDAAVDPDIEALKRKTGREFDVAYMALAGPDAHERAVTLFQSEAEKGRDPDLRTFAQQTLPTLRHHLSEAREVSAKVEMGK
ncbi:MULTISPECIES: DUF4142 domain-containing protein [Pandoraea]|uniref:DUF4142 domain-containing protein n=1 Tax=Pandoraea TaxID=93217 RepID=UPI0004651EBE|nr:MULTISPECIES: DUF4142 domain-containing protein [Pandoraea]AHB78105.2 hypothetical protein X636_23715 [Pandoraea pnomenusa]ANC46766.1 hypothetical protein A6P55_23955 [Pandoraea pnomenusa]